MQSPGPPRTLYHYCSTEAFYEIVKTKSIWLSSLSLSNDTLEGEKIIARIIDRLAAQGVFKEQVMWRFKYTFMQYERQWEGLGFCLSERGDLLSQWRGYAKDATGVAIGFAYDSLLKLAMQSGKPPLSLEKIEYDSAVHWSLTKPIYQRILDYVNNNPLMPFDKTMANVPPLNYEGPHSSDEIMMSKFALGSKDIHNLLFRLKLPAFKEEEEWRLLNLSMRGASNYFYRPRGILLFRI